MTMSIGTLRHNSPEASVADYCKTSLQRPARRGPVQMLLDLLFTWQERANQRYSLKELDDRLLRDIGLDRLDADLEAAKPFWRP